MSCKLFSAVNEYSMIKRSLINLTHAIFRLIFTSNTSKFSRLSEIYGLFKETFADVSLNFAYLFCLQRKL